MNGIVVIVGSYGSGKTEISINLAVDQKRAAVDVRVADLDLVNPYCPFTDTTAGCLKIKNEIEIASRMSVSGIVGNANLIDETTADDIIKGYRFVKKLWEESGFPLEFITVAAELLSQIDIRRFSCPILVIERQLVPPWQKAAKLGIKNYALHRNILGR